MEPKRHTENPKNITNQTVNQDTTGEYNQPIQVFDGEVTVTYNQQTVNKNSCSPLVMMAIFGYILLHDILLFFILFLFRKGNSCNRNPKLIYIEAKTAVLKKSVIEQIVLAAIGFLIPGAIAGGAVVTVLGAAGVLLPKEGCYIKTLFLGQNIPNQIVN